MKYRITVDSIENCLVVYCFKRSCTADDCGICKAIGPRHQATCLSWIHNHPAEAANIMGVEIVEDEET